MSRRSNALVLAFGLMLSAPASVFASADPPVIRKPMPAPATPPNVPPLPPAYFDPTLDIGGQDLKAKEVDTRLNVQVLVNGVGPYRFVVDSGADTSVVGLRIARDLQLPLGTPAILNGTTSRNIVDRVLVRQLTLGTTTIENLEIPALRESDVGADGLIGIDALAKQRLMMDFDKHIVKVEDAAKPPKFDRNDIVIIARRQRGQLILTQVRASRVSLDAIIDTGSEITIGNIALRDRLLRRGHKFDTVTAIGVTGAVMKLQITTIDELQLGPVKLNDVPIAFADIPPFKMFGLANEPALMLGTDILESFKRVSLDFKARKVRFQLRRCRSEGVMISTSTTLSRLSSIGGAETCGP